MLVQVCDVLLTYAPVQLPIVWDHFLPAAEADYSQAKKKWTQQKKKVVGIDISLGPAASASAVAVQTMMKPAQRKQDKLPGMPKPCMQQEEI